MLTPCPHCQGFLPPQARTTCPHCHRAIKPTTRSSLLTTALSLASGGLVATTLMACYGAPPPPPGGPNPPSSSACEPSAEDMDGDCFTADVDCDDTQDTIHPEAKDGEGDGEDTNCDGVDGVAQGG